MKLALSTRDTNKMARGLFDIVKNARAVDNGLWYVGDTADLSASCHTHAVTASGFGFFIVDWIVNPYGFQAFWCIITIDRQTQIFSKAIMASSVKFAGHMQNIVLWAAPISIQNRFFTFDHFQCLGVPSREFLSCKSHSGKGHQQCQNYQNHPHFFILHLAEITFKPIPCIFWKQSKILSHIGRVG